MHFFSDERFKAVKTRPNLFLLVYVRFGNFRYTPYIRTLFIALTGLAVLWDVMLVGTVLYFHTMVQKVAGGILAVLCWYFVYRFWYPSSVLPPLPGVGLIRYSEGYRRA